MSTRNLMVTIALLLVASAAADLLLTSPTLDRIERLSAQRQKALARFEKIRSASEERDFLTAALGVERLADLRNMSSETDGFVFLGRTLDEAGLSRLELSSDGTTDSTHLRRSSYSVLATGRYSEILTFVRSLENGERLVTIDVLQINRTFQDDRLECRASISLYDPIGKERS